MLINETNLADGLDKKLKLHVFAHNTVLSVFGTYGSSEKNKN